MADGRMVDPGMSLKFGLKNQLSNEKTLVGWVI